MNAKKTPESKLNQSRQRSEQWAESELKAAKAEAEAAKAEAEAAKKLLSEATKTAKAKFASYEKTISDLKHQVNRAKPDQSERLAKVNEELKKAIDGQLQFSVKGNAIDILKYAPSPEYPESIFPVDRLEAEEIDPDADLKSISGYIKKEHGSGRYVLRAWNTSKGFAQFAGQTELTL